jgi:peptidyl-prolyl cis-trans isomerase C
VAILLFLGLAALIMRYSICPSQARYPEWIVQKERMLANKLRGAGFPGESAMVLERYLQMSNTNPQEWSKIAYTIGQLYMEAKDYEKAVPWLYEVELADPDTGLASKVSQLIVTCLERLGRYQAAEYALTARTALDPNQLRQETQGDKMIAQIGQDIITLNQFNQVLDELPPWIKKELSDTEKKREFAEQYIAEELLYRKGLKLGYEENPASRKKIEQFKRQLVIAQVRKTEIEDKLTIDDADVKNYFIAHQNRYKDPNQKDPPEFEEIKERVKEDYEHSKMQQMYQELIRQVLLSTDVKLNLENVN